ncbi:hypothetical protein EDD11_009650, partial [Mortierella claussenii]
MFLPEEFEESVRVRLYTARLIIMVPALIQEMRMRIDILRPDRSSDGRKELELAAKSVFITALPTELQDADWDALSNAAVRYAKI